MMKIGSPEWFHENAKVDKHQQFVKRMESLRKTFYASFNPERLKAMNGEELLTRVFGNSSSSMIHLLMFSEDYRMFGSTGKYAYLGVLFQVKDGTWEYKETARVEVLSREEAANRAIVVRDKLMECVEIIKSTGKYLTIMDYEKLEKRLSKVFFAKFAWAMKYFQMIFPQYFPCMYADDTLGRAVGILGLPNHGKSHRFMNAGEVSLFIRRCDVSNLAFNDVYAAKWGWDRECPPCENAEQNFDQRTRIVDTIKLEYYSVTESIE